MNRLVLTLLALSTSSSVYAQEKHLFILSGQSNMKRLDPEASFSPAVRKALGEDRVIVVKDAEGGQSIRRWYKKWKDVKNYRSMKPDTSADSTTIGDLYDRLMKKVAAEITGKSIKTVTFVWMQGEADSGKHYVVYEQSLKGLVQQLEDDLKPGKVNVVIGRLSDAKMTKPGWLEIRKIQQSLCDAHSNWEWVNTDDVNGENNGVHYTREGYVEFGKRLAAKAIQLISFITSLLRVLPDTTGVLLVGSMPTERVIDSRDSEKPPTTASITP